MGDIKNDPVTFIGQLIEGSGGKVDAVGILPDGSGFATASFPLPADHWLTRDPDGFNVPPMGLRMGTDNPQRKEIEGIVREAGKYAVRSATRNGQVEDFDPDALIQNLIVGLLGYHTSGGLGGEDWMDPSPTPSEVKQVRFDLE